MPPILRVAILIALLLPAARAFAEDDTLTQAKAALKAAKIVLDDGVLGRQCQSLRSAYDALHKSAKQHPELPGRTAVEGELIDRRKLYCNKGAGKLVGKPTGTTEVVRAPTEDELYAAYLLAVEQLKMAVASCSASQDCPELAEAQDNLKRCAMYLLRKLKIGSERALDVEKSLAGVLSTDANTMKLITVLSIRQLNPNERAALFNLATTDHGSRLEQVQKLLTQLGDQMLNDAEVETLFAEVTQLAEKHGRDVLEVLRGATIEAMLRNPGRRHVLERVLELVVDRYPVLGAKASAAEKALKVGGSNDDTVRRFFDSVDPLVYQEIYKESRRANAVVPDMATETGFAPSPVLVHFSKDLLEPSEGCRPGHAFLRKWVNTLHFQGGPRSGLQPFVRVHDKEKIVDDIKEILNKESAAAACLDYRNKCPSDNVSPACTEDLLPYARLCSFPKPGVFLLSVEKVGESEVKVSGRWWERSDTNPWDSGTIESVTLPIPCQKAKEDTLALGSAREVARDVSLFKVGPLASNRPGPVRIEARSSPWLAAAFSGVPFLNDDRSTTMARVAPTAIDGLLLGGIATSFSLAVHYRNQYARGREPTLSPANTAIDVGVGLTAGLLVTRAISGWIYGRTQFWQKSPPPQEQALRR